MAAGRLGPRTPLRGWHLRHPRRAWTRTRSRPSLMCRAHSAAAGIASADGRVGPSHAVHRGGRHTCVGRWTARSHDHTILGCVSSPCPCSPCSPTLSHRSRPPLPRKLRSARRLSGTHPCTCQHRSRSHHRRGPSLSRLGSRPALVRREPGVTAFAAGAVMAGTRFAEPSPSSPPSIDRGQALNPRPWRPACCGIQDADAQ